MIVATLVLAVLPCTAPDVITVTAVLEENGAPLDREINASFTLWDASTTGTSLWSDDARTFTVIDGVVVVELGAAHPLPAHVFSQQTWLEVIVDGQRLEPRVRITSAPHALEAAHAMNADTCSSLDGLAADDVVTHDALNVPVYSRPRVCGGGIALESTCNTLQCRFGVEPSFFDCSGACESESPLACSLVPVGLLGRLP